MVTPLEKFAESNINARKYDENENFDESLLPSLAELGVHGLQAPVEFNGAGLNNTEYARMVSVVSARDLSLATHLGAHQGIGYKGILLFGTEKQKRKYLPDLVTGKSIAAYCLTEPGSGSDVSSIQMTADPSPDGGHYILNGTKVWITNGGIASVFTVFAKTPVKEKDGKVKDKITAFIVERGFGGLSHGDPEKKMGIRASNTATVYFEDCKVPVENVLGEVGEGFKLAVNILNQGRFVMAAGLSGMMRAVIKQTAGHAVRRKQFGRTLNGFQNVQEKLSTMAVRQYATESMAYMLSGAMDLGAKDYQTEAAISKIYSSESAWYCTDEAIQILGGTGYMRDSNLERILRDLRVYRIFEGANDVLRLFVSLTGLRYAGKHLSMKSKSPTGILGLGVDKLGRTLKISGEGRNLKLNVPTELSHSASLTGEAIDAFGDACLYLLSRHGKDVIEEQFRLTRLADSAIHIYAMICCLSRAARAIQDHSKTAEHEVKMTNLVCEQGYKTINSSLTELRKDENDRVFGLMKSISADVCEEEGVVCSTPIGF
ncbi:unnamed protein product [Calicophoron daubneyi]